MVAISDVVRQSTDTDDFDDDPTDGFGDDQDAAIEDQRERLESPPVSFDDIGEAHQEIDVFVDTYVNSSPREDSPFLYAGTSPRSQEWIRL